MFDPISVAVCIFLTEHICTSSQISLVSIYTGNYVARRAMMDITPSPESRRSRARHGAVLAPLKRTITTAQVFAVLTLSRDAVELALAGNWTCANTSIVCGTDAGLGSLTAAAVSANIEDDQNTCSKVQVDIERRTQAL
ncbi:hypothetical protein L226DRAFT_524519 [Lentinus tigrinus ALCF2SS1-7]|uniref:uncharacterized protein n=1 Tax=Lentinus tigrinus ALCF2SS1-7 TaxID=1328758 RepID=UPI001165D355|nr:hypothetical protein L226DRAFT_524519 [Lentinus tigrinus ALCF2SS1-7]